MFGRYIGEGALAAVGSSYTLLTFLTSVIMIAFYAFLDPVIRGAAIATVIAQYVSGIGILIYFLAACPKYRIRRADMRWVKHNFKRILSLSGFTCLQQSVMNLGILMVQGVVNSFCATVMAAFAVAVKIDTIAYMPVRRQFASARSICASKAPAILVSAFCLCSMDTIAPLICRIFR